MRKKLILFSFFVCVFFLGAMQLEAAPIITNISWGVNKQNVVRTVFECTSPTKAELEVKDDELIVTVKATPKANSLLKRYTPANSKNIRYLLAENEGKSKTVLHVKLKKKLTKKDYKLFTLKKDPGANRPDRVVLDVANGPLVKDISYQGSSTTSRPVLPTYSVKGGIVGKKITLDAGHGGSDPGAHGLNGTLEKNITLPITKKLKKLLEDKGAIISMTRTTDVDVYGPNATDKQELQARVDVAERNKADLFISVHINANPNREIGGFSSYYNSKTKYDYAVAENIQNRLLKTGNLRDLGVRHANFYVNKRCSMPGALIEVLFVSNPREEKLLNSNWFQNKVADAIANGIEDFYHKQ